jgi:hypothetical protein
MARYTKGLWSHAWWSDPVVLGRYPEKGVKAVGAAMPGTLPVDPPMAARKSGGKIKREGGGMDRDQHEAAAFEFPHPFRVWKRAPVF